MTDISVAFGFWSVSGWRERKLNCPIFVGLFGEAGTKRGHI